MGNHRVVVSVDGVKAEAKKAELSDSYYYHNQIDVEFINSSEALRRISIAMEETGKKKPVHIVVIFNESEVYSAEGEITRIDAEYKSFTALCLKIMRMI